MKRYIILAGVCVAAIVWSATEKVYDKYGGAYPLWLDKGLYVGGTSNPNSPVGDTLNKLAAIRTCKMASVNIGAAAAATTVVATGTCTGVAVGDSITAVSPSADDAAWDEGPLTAFVESANTIKLVYHADASGGDPASMDYYITFIKRQ